MTLTLPLPETASVDERFAREALAAILYATGKLSGYEARQALGMSRRAFEEMLPRYGVSIFIGAEDEIEAELSA